MTPCETLSEKMPAMRHGAERWTAEEADHLASCPDCRWEWDLVATGAVLGEVLQMRHGPVAGAKCEAMQRCGKISQKLGKSGHGLDTCPRKTSIIRLE